LDKAEARRIFTSGSNGIVAAKEATDGSGTLAISDALNVILHQVEDGIQTSYRLKGSDVSEAATCCHTIQNSSNHIIGTNSLVEILFRLEDAILHDHVAQLRPGVLVVRGAAA
jgi:hypothetical protein